MKFHREFGMRLLPAAFVAGVALLVMPSCKEDEKEVISGDFDPEHFATMTTVNVSTLISDSGVTRYHIQAPLWLMFDEAAEPRWTFPQGLMLEKYDDLFRIDAKVECDSATFFKDKQLWRLDGYVDIENMSGEKFLTEQLFWDQRRQKIYSDSFIHIERADRIIEGYGFESNDRMSNYHVKQVSGIFPASQFQGDGEAAEEAPDTAVATVQYGPPVRTSQRRRVAAAPLSSEGAVSSTDAVPDVVPERPLRKLDIKRRVKPERQNDKK